MRKLIVTLLLLCNLLAGCSDSSSLKSKISSLQNENYQLNQQLAKIRDLDFMNIYNGGYFSCDNPYLGISKIEFLALTVVYVTGHDNQGQPEYNNYYVLKYVEEGKFKFVDELKLADSLPYHTYELIDGARDKFMDHLEISKDGQSLTIVPSPQPVTCKFIKN